MRRNPHPAGRGPHRDPAREQRWRGLLRQFAASGQGVREFCAARQLKETAFYFWRGEIARRDGGAPASVHRRRPTKPCPVDFARVLLRPTEPQAAMEGARLRLAGGRELLLPASMAVEQIASLVRGIEGNA